MILFGWCDSVFIELVTSKSDKTSNESPLSSITNTIDILYCFILLWSIFIPLAVLTAAVMCKRITCHIVIEKWNWKSAPLKMNFPKESKMWQNWCLENLHLLIITSATTHKKTEEFLKHWTFFERGCTFHIYYPVSVCSIQKWNFFRSKQEVSSRHPLIMFYPFLLTSFLRCRYLLFFNTVSSLWFEFFSRIKTYIKYQSKTHKSHWNFDLIHFNIVNRNAY